MNRDYKKYYIYLEKLRQSGETNMWGATPYLVHEFFPELDDKKAEEVLLSWISNYSEIRDWLKAINEFPNE